MFLWLVRCSLPSPNLEICVPLRAGVSGATGVVVEAYQSVQPMLQQNPLRRMNKLCGDGACFQELKPLQDRGLATLFPNCMCLIESFVLLRAAE